MKNEKDRIGDTILTLAVAGAAVSFSGLAILILAWLGEPQSVWLVCDILGVTEVCGE